VLSLIEVGRYDGRCAATLDSLVTLQALCQLGSDVNAVLNDGDVPFIFQRARA
jgi:hypothetical protein